MPALSNFHLDTELVPVPIDELRPAPKQPRKHSREKIKKLSRTIAQSGHVTPLLVDEGMVIIAGHARLAACKALGYTHLPVQVYRGHSEAERQALALADNKLAEQGRWDPEALAEVMAELLEANFDTSLTGFDDAEIDKLLMGSPSLDELQPPPEPPQSPVSRPGDLWACGDHRVLCGDGLAAESIHRVLGGASADMVFTDPPYNVVIKGNVSGRGRKVHGEFAAASGEMSYEQYRAFLATSLAACKASLRDGAVVFVFIDWRHIDLVLEVGREVFDGLLNICVWVKNNAGMGSFYRSQHEFVAIFHSGTKRPDNNIRLGRYGRNRSNTWFYEAATAMSKTRQADLEAHPTVKPIQLVADAIQDVTGRGDLVLDPFGGSGTTLLAAETVGRRAALIELDPKYVDVILQRYQKATGVEPALLPDRIPFSKVQAERQEAVDA